MIEILINPNGDDFARVLNNQIRLLKRRAIAQKLYDYYYTKHITSVDIPEFCKMDYDKIQTIVTREVDAIENSGNLDFLYKKLEYNT